MRLHGMTQEVAVEQPLIGRIARTAIPPHERADAILYGAGGAADRSGYLAVVPTVAGLEYLADGDVVSLDPNGFVRVLYRKSSPHNFILVTERCNSYCLMCSQPPRELDERGRILTHLRLVDLIDADTPELGITGGEPTLLGDDFLRLVDHCGQRLPRTALHVLTNGRRFSRRRFAARLAALAHPDLMLGIPVYSDLDSEHDYIVQAEGAFEETILGLHHLAACEVPVEIRVVLHRQTIPRLVRLAEFISRTLPFAAHVALMGLEAFGFVHKNLDELWIDPWEYREALSEAVEILHLSGLRVSIYNHQLCVLPPELWRFARQSISDWKNVHLPLCDGCGVKASCGGFFQSGVKRVSARVRPLTPSETTPPPPARSRP